MQILAQWVALALQKAFLVSNIKNELLAQEYFPSTNMQWTNISPCLMHTKEEEVNSDIGKEAPRLDSLIPRIQRPLAQTTRMHATLNMNPSMMVSRPPREEAATHYICWLWQT
jgi:hypothetical protein